MFADQTKRDDAGDQKAEAAGTDLSGLGHPLNFDNAGNSQPDVNT